MINVYDFILEGDEATEENAIISAMNMVWGEMETSEQDIKYHNYIDTIDGIGIYYDFGADYYFFTDESGED